MNLILQSLLYKAPMRERTDWRLSSLLHDNAEQFKEHFDRIEKILDRAQDIFEKDHAGTVGATGMLLLLSAPAFPFWIEPWILSGISTVTGGVLFAAGLVIGHKSGTNQLKYANTLVKLERERARFQQRTALLNHVWLHGLPEGTPLAQIQILLGDSPSLPPPSGGQLEWKALPLEGSTNEDKEDLNE